MQIFFRYIIMTIKNLIPFFSILLFVACSQKAEQDPASTTNASGQEVYQDKPFKQKYSIRYYLTEDQENEHLSAIANNRNGHIEILSDKGILVPENGQLFYPGKLVNSVAYTPLFKKKITAVSNYKEHIIYLDNTHVFSNAWAGLIQIEHELPRARLVAGGKDFHFLVSDGTNLVYLNKEGKKIWSGTLNGVKQIVYNELKDQFLLVQSNGISTWKPGSEITETFKAEGINCAEVLSNGKIVVGTNTGYLYTDENKVVSNVPHPEITSVKEIYGEVWFGSNWGAFKLNKEGKYDYYAGERWLPGNKVMDLAAGPDNTVMVLTNKGVGQLHFKEMTLEQKARFYDKQVREKNIRYGFNCCISRLPNGYASAQMGTQASDNLWTSMYLASQLYRYKVTGEEEAKLNAYEAYEAMERLHTITGIDGLFARSYERDYKVSNTKKPGWQEHELKTGSPATMWLRGVDHPNWTWRSTVSSDQTVGQMFALTTILELADDEEWKQRALKHLDDLMSYIVDNDYYIIDVDGEPTLWGKWNPDYVNNFPTNVGDRRLNSSNIIAFLQTAYKFTGKEKYKEAAYYLMEKHGYLENLVRPIAEVGPSKEDVWSENLSHEWNHSDDEMYFLAYWGLYPYAFDENLKEQYRVAIQDHWNVERPEKNALWNIIYAMTGAKEFDLDESIWWLQEYPLDLRMWGMHNSHRNDIELLPENFRLQTTKELLPLSEVPLYRHNGNVFKLDQDGDGTALISAGDTWLLPYWMGRYLEVISAPENE